MAYVHFSQGTGKTKLYSTAKRAGTSKTPPEGPIYIAKIAGQRKELAWV